MSRFSTFQHKTMKQPGFLYLNLDPQEIGEFTPQARDVIHKWTRQPLKVPIWIIFQLSRSSNCFTIVCSKMAGSRGIERVLAKCEACISDGNFYEAHQMIRTLYFRLVVVYVWFILMVWSDNFLVESFNQPVFLDAKPKRISIWHSTAITLIISYNIQFFIV